jgi:hypothetical protein
MLTAGSGRILHESAMDPLPLPPWARGRRSPLVQAKRHLLETLGARARPKRPCRAVSAGLLPQKPPVWPIGKFLSASGMKNVLIG